MKTPTSPSHNRFTNRRALILASSIASVFVSVKAGGASAIWSGATDTLWSLDTNWAGPVPGLGDTATFNGLGNGNVVLDLGGSGVTVGSLTFDTSSVAGYTLGTGAAGSQALTLGNAGTISLTSTVVANQLVNAALTLGNDGTAQTFTLANESTTNSLTVAGSIAGSIGSGVKTLAVAGSGATTLSGTISNGTGGTVAISKTGNGTLALSNTGNTFSGGVTVGAAAGVVTATMAAGTNASGLGTGAVSIGAGSTVNVQAINTVNVTNVLNNIFTGSGLLKLTFAANTTARNTSLGDLSGFAGTIQLSNLGVTGDKLNTNANMVNLAAALVVDSGSTLFVSGPTSFNGGISLNGIGNNEGRGAIRMGTAVLRGNISLAGSSTIGLDANTYGILTGNISADGLATLTFGGSQAGNGTLTGNLSDGPGTLSLTKANAGTLWLTGTNNYTGATTITGGRLQLGLGGTTGSLSPNSSVIVSSGASITFNRSNAMALGTDFGAISGAGNVTQNGTGTTTFGGATALTYTGITAINRGTLALDFAALATPTNMINSGSALQLGGGRLSVLGNGVGTTAQTFNGTTLTAGRSVIAPNRGTGTSTTVTLGALTSSAGSSINFTPTTAWASGATSSAAGVASATEIVTVTGVTRNGAVITIPTSGFIYIGANVFNGIGASTRYAVAQGAAAAPYQIVGGPLSTAFLLTGGSASTIYSASTSQTLTGATTNYAFIGNNGATAITIANGGFAYTLNGYLGIGTNTVTMSGAGALTIGAEKDLVINNANTGGLTISSVIANSAGGASSVTNSSTGTGIFTLSGANTYTGGTFFNGGTTSIATDGAASANAQLGFVPAAATPGNLTFNGGTLRFVPTVAQTLNANRGITLGASGGTITNTAAFSVTISPIIAGIGGLTLSNTSTNSLVIGGANTFTGGTILNNGGSTGPIIANNNAAFGVGGVLTLNGGILRAGATANITLANPVNIAADTTFQTVAAEKSLIFTGPASLSGTRTLTSAVGSTVGGIAVQFNNGISESTALSGLTKAGAGEIVLGGVNTFTGPTSITAGRLTYTKAFALYANNPASWTDTNITVGSAGTLNLRVGGTNEFTAANVAAISALGTATGGFQNGSYIGLDTGSGNFTYGNVLANTNGGANSIGLMKLGANSLTLSSANTYTGITYIGGGTLIAANTSAFGPSGNGVAFVAATNGAASGANLTNGNIEFATDSSVNAYDLIGSSTFTSTITVSRATPGAAVSHALGQLNWGNNIFNAVSGTNNTSGTPALSFTGMNLTAGGAGNSTLNPTTATIAITGATNIGTNNAAKTLVLDGTIAGNSISGDITNNLNTLTLTKSNTSTWTLSGTNTYTGATNVNAGTLRLDYTTQNNSKLSDTAILTLGGGTLDLTGGSHTEIVLSTTLTANTASSVTSSTLGSVLQMGVITRNTGATIDFALPNIATTDNLNTNGILGPWATVGGGTDYAVNSTNAAGGLITAPAYSDVPRLTPGTIADGAATHVRIIEGGGAAGSILLGAATTTVSTLNQSASGGASAATIDPAGQTLSTNSILLGTGAGGLTIGTGVNNGTLTAATAAGDLAFINNTANDITINSPIADNSISTLTKLGTGPLILTGNNTYTGVTTIGSGNATAGGGGKLVLSGNNVGATGSINVGNGGTLELRSANAAGTLGTGVSRIGLFDGSNLRLLGDSSLTFNGTDAIAGLNTATIGIDVNQLTGAGTNQTLTISPGVTSVGNAVTINITGGNGYTLGFGTIQNVTGTATNVTLNPTTAKVSLGGYDALNNAANNSTLTLGGTSTGNVVTGVIANQAAGSTGTGTTAVVKTGSSSWNLQGANTYTGNLTVREGTLTLSGAKTGNSGAITVGDTAGLSATLNISTGTYPLAANSFNVGNQATTPGTATVNQSGGAVSFTSGNQLLIGQNTVGNTGIYNLSGGSITTVTSATRGIMLGVNANATGIFNLSGTGVLNMTAASGGGGNAFLQIGRSDAATADNTTTLFNQTGGTANVGILGIGGNGANGINLNSTLTLTGGTFIASTFTVLAAGNTNTATINIGGTADVTLPAFPTARGTSSTATINFDGGTLRPLAASATYMGSLTNAFVKAGGVKFDTGALAITVTQALLTDAISTGGGLTKAGSAILTLTGANTYTGKTVVSAGTISFNSIGNVGGGSSALGAPTTVAEGTIDLAGGLTYTGAATSTNRVINLTDSAATATINNIGSGLLTLNGDVTGNSSNILYRGAESITMNGVIPATHTGAVTHTDAGTLTLTNAANAFTGALIVSRGIVSVDTIDNKGVASGIGAGTLITLGQSGFNNTGTFQFTGVGGGSSDRDIDIQSNGANANGGIIENTVAGQLLTLSGNITVGGTGTLPTLGLTGAGNGRLSGNILGTSPLAITKSGTGTWTLAGANTQTGATTVNAGTLNITGSISGSAVVVNSTGTLTGSGFTGALTVNSGGTVAPGQSPGVISTGAATFAAGSTLAIEINGLTLGTQYDQLSVAGAVNITGATLSLSGSYLTTPPVTNDLFTILLNDGNSDAITGTFAGLAEGAHAFSGFGQDYTISYVGGDGNDIVLTAVPEPGSAVLVFGGLALLGARRRRRME